MSRPSDWYPLAVMDPVAGDPERVRAAGEEYRGVARQIEAAADELRAIASEMDGGSAAVDEVDAKATRLADTIERAHGRYAATGEALLTYAGALAHAQELSLAAHTTAVTALHAQDEALASIAWWTRMADGASDPAVRDRYLALADDARTDLRSADGQLDAARTDLRVAVAQRDGAVSAACAAIRGAMDRDDLHDTMWQDLGGGVQEVGLHLWNGVDEVATVLAIAAVLLCWMPGVNGVLAAAATIAGVLLLFRDSVDLASGNGSGEDVRASALGVVTFGVGRFAQQGIRLSVAAARGGRTLRQVDMADDAAGVAAHSAAHSSVGAATRSRLDQVAGGLRNADVLRSAELWQHMRPGVIARDTWNQLRGGVDLVAAPGLYRPSASGHVSRPVDTVANPLREYGVEVATTWTQHKGAGAFTAVGNEAAARALTATSAGGTAHGWVALSGGVQVVESACALAPAASADALRDSCSLDVKEVRR
ncbi:hypothetical protein [Cellulomonas sp. S1-8]|uniref:hypothetical protein n=1 Tax=Cellulomonas sp. S1-8 TaxID=2904790 RepID=UPI002243830A|nr:hypothetical protein [Cellulomonas sp. S1-8]UZN04779.1 hypothetical protein OKX07_07725 [Cellulomonas sp. S1-8]